MDQIIRAQVFQDGRRAGELTKTGDTGFQFKYDAEYLSQPSALPISRSFPLTRATYESQKLFPFFEGLVSEGFLRDVQTETQKVDERDSFQLLLNNGEDLIGSVSVIPIKESQ